MTTADPTRRSPDTTEGADIAEGTNTIEGTALRDLNQELVRHARLLHVVRTRMAAEFGGGLDTGALAVLMHVVASGGLRQRELAGCAMLDPSTVSRHVSVLVRLGHVRRSPDPDDGRAVRLEATDSGRALRDRVVARREELIRSGLATWSEDDLGELTRWLRRLNDDFEASRPFGIHPMHTTHPLHTGPPTPLSRPSRAAISAEER